MKIPTRQENLRYLVKSLNTATLAASGISYSDGSHENRGVVNRAKIKGGKLAVKIFSPALAREKWIENADEINITEPYPGYLLKFDARYN